MKNEVSYNVFHKRYMDTRKRIFEVKVDGLLVEDEAEVKFSKLHSVSQNTPVHIWIDIRMGNELHLFQKNLSCDNLVRIVKKLEGLC